MNNLLILAQADSAGSATTQIFFGAIYVLVCLSMIAAILMKTPKSDGFGGMMGGSASMDTSAYKGSKSKDDKIDTITNWIALTFIAMSIGLNYVF